MIIKYGIGVNNIDVEAATRKGIYVCNVPDYGVEEVSDHTVAMMLALAKKLPVLTLSLIHISGPRSRGVLFRRKSGKSEKYGRGSEAGDQHHFPGAELKPVFECCGKYLSGKYA